MAVPVSGEVGCFKQIIVSQSKGNSKGKHKAHSFNIHSASTNPMADPAANTEGYAPNGLPLEGRKALAEEAMQLFLAFSTRIYLSFILRQDLKLYPRLISNYVPASVSLPRAGIICKATVS